MEFTSTAVSGKQFRFVLVLTAGLMLLAGAALADDSSRVSVSRQGTGALRTGGAPLMESRDEFAALQTTGDRKTESSRQSKAGQAVLESANVDFWFYTADVVLFNDHDNDGYFAGIDLLFDADTYFTEADVYAVVYLSYEGGPWNEYAATENFTIFGATSDDDYVIVTELVSGYPSGSYDLLVELYDAYDDSFLAWIGPEDTSELAFLQLEDSNRDTPFDRPDVVVVHEHGGGSAGWLLLLALLATAVSTRVRAARSA